MFLFFVAFLLISKLCLASDDGKYFSGLDFEKKITHKIRIFFNSDVRLKDGLGNLYYYHLRPGVKFNLFKYLDAAVIYRYVNEKKERANLTYYWNYENRLEMDIIPKYNLTKNLVLSNRFRFEYKTFEVGHIDWRLRDELKLFYNDFHLFRFIISPYIANETYHPMREGKMNRIWSTIGFVKKWTGNLSTDIFYRVETERVGKNNQWDTNHILGTTFKYNF